MTRSRIIATSIIAVTVLTLLFVFCTGGESQAATRQAEPPAGSFTVQLVPTLSTLSGGQCWGWGFGAWENRDGFNRLRFAYGENIVACTNAAATRWHSMPTFNPYHYVGYWRHEKTNKWHGSLGYAFLDISTTWKFEWKAVGVPLAHMDRTLTCRLWASNHTAYCTRYYN